MNEIIEAFLKDPNRETYLAVREQLIASRFYEPYSDDFKTINEIYEEGDIEKARQTLQSAMGNLMLSPRAHFLLGFMHHKLEEEDGARAEVLFANACLHGILSTGEGTAESPYLVVRTSDEYDVLEYFQKELKQQVLSHDEDTDRHYDMLECTDGSTYCFDITDAYKKLSFGDPE